ncbi:hypothetical protein ElyMa_004423800 [Elysia marginata]|uniref:Uncharacterized protein n=1 Tax=Elysia marginata TaxID=1093978 RepID=A0AAV4HC10_9GAST|nr:hypothetical protein ElyMa_004423800 [Elysia marginata]
MLQQTSVMSSKRGPLMGFFRFGNRQNSDEINPASMEDVEEFQICTVQLSQLFVALDEQERYHAKARLRFEAFLVFSLLIQTSVFSATVNSILL